MNLNEEIKRIKGLMVESSDPYTILVRGDINNVPGAHISLREGETKLGHVNLLNFNDSYKWDDEIPRILGGDSKIFNDDNSVYLYDLKIYESNRGKGLSNHLMDKCHTLAEHAGKKYITLIVDSDNLIAQKLYKKYGYKSYDSDNFRDLLYKTL